MKSRSEAREKSSEIPENPSSAGHITTKLLPPLVRQSTTSLLQPGSKAAQMIFYLAVHIPFHALAQLLPTRHSTGFLGRLGPRVDELFEVEFWVFGVRHDWRHQKCPK